ncbi:MAG: 6-hydroxymethylpterin diphosphokinase MptE-like protein [bacterium]
MDYSILDKNLEEIKRYNPLLVEKIKQHTFIEKSFDFQESATGEVILTYDGRPLHDDYNAQAEAEDVFSKIPCDNKNALHVIFGIGIGYLFKRFLLSAKGKIILFEPNLDILRIALEVVDFSDDLARKNVMIVQNPMELEKAFEIMYFDNSDITLSFLPSYRKMYPIETNRLLNDLGFLKGMFASNYKNLFDRAHAWTISGIENIPYTMMNSQLEELRGKFKNVPAVIISAGPSLDKNIHLVNDYRDKVVVFSVGTASKAVDKHHIIPDFLTIVEQNNCTEQVRGIDTSEMNLILQPMTHKNFHEMPTKTKFNYYANNDFTVKWINKHLNIPLDDYHNKGTVSLCAMFSAIIMGCDPIIMIGQDLAYSEGKCYSLNSAYSNIKCTQNPETGEYEVCAENMDEFCNTFNVNAEDARSYLTERFEELTKNIYFVRGLNGKMIPTSASYATFIRYFETSAAELEGQKIFINATEGGAFLEGYKHITLKEALETYANTHIDVKKIIDEAKKSDKKISQDSRNNIIKEIVETIDIFENLKPNFDRSGENVLKLKNMYINKKYAEAEFSKLFSEVISDFIKIEADLIVNNIAVFGLICEQYMKLSNFIKAIDTNIEIENLEEFLNLAYEFFITAYQVINNDMIIFNKVKEKLCDSCYSAS